MRHAIHNAYKATAEAILPVRSSSAFLEKGVLTPEEYVAAGDFLVSTCPTWSWEAGEESKRRPYLPSEKQYLVTRNIPCLCRAKDLLKGKMEEELIELAGAGGDGEAWVSTGGTTNKEEEEDIEDMSLEEEVANKLTLKDAGEGEEKVEAATAAADGENNNEGDDSESDCPDMEDFVVEEEDDTVTIHHTREATGGAGQETGGSDSKILKTRTYDISVTYDKYYQTPRFWLIGYDESRQLLKPELSLEDVSAEHAEKTVTIDLHPHLPLSSASIHPCKHAHVMKKLLDNLSEGDKEISVEHYLVIFLKFIASIVPTIDYDYTMAADVGGSSKSS
jgi:ubiquitin-like-conjugating enzyme ATG3